MSERLCESCGKKLEATEEFCTECGTRSPAVRTDTKGEMVPRETIRLDSLDGFEFENFCAHVFERLEYPRVQIMPFVGDKGRDLIIYTSQGTKIVVECKHHPHGTIGRPVVQKLHSAVVTEDAAKGMIVTTGKFSAEAIAHARAIKPQVDLVDMNVLRDMCERANIHIVTGLENESVLYFPTSDGQNVGRLAVSRVASKMVSHPAAPNSLFELCETHLSLRPLYRIRYNVHQNFNTSVGTIYQVHENDQELLLDGTTGEQINDNLETFLKGVHTSEISARSNADVQERGSFKVDQTSLARKTKMIIAKRHSRRVSYYGRNHVRYTTVCTPGERSILVRDVKQVYAPEWSLSLLLLSKGYDIKLVERPQTVFFLRNELRVCKICGKRITEEMLLCNSCGNVAHKGKSHGYRCRTCKKSICRNCTHWTRRLLFLRAYLCEKCALEKQKAKKKTQQLVQTLSQIRCVNCDATIPHDALRCMKCHSNQTNLKSASLRSGSGTTLHVCPNHDRVMSYDVSESRYFCPSCRATQTLESRHQDR